jgi:hypothetical protein
MRGRLAGLRARLQDAESRNPLDRQFHREPLAVNAAYRPPGPARDAAVLENKQKFIAPIAQGTRAGSEAPAPGSGRQAQPPGAAGAIFDDPAVARPGCHAQGIARARVGLGGRE